MDVVRSDDAVCFVKVYLPYLCCDGLRVDLRGCVRGGPRGLGGASVVARVDWEGTSGVVRGDSCRLKLRPG